MAKIDCYMKKKIYTLMRLYFLKLVKLDTVVSMVEVRLGLVYETNLKDLSDDLKILLRSNGRHYFHCNFARI